MNSTAPRPATGIRPTRRERFSALVVALLTLLLLAPAGAASAATSDDSTSWLVQPAGPRGGADARSYFSYDASPGEYVEDVVRIVNHADADLTLALYGTDAFTDTASGGFGLLATAERPDDVGAWVTMGVSEVTVPARSSVDVPFLISVPANATPGDHAGGVVTSYVTAVNTETGEKVDFDARIAVRIYLNVRGAIAPALIPDDIRTSFELDASQLTGTLRVNYALANTGNVRLGAEETVAVRGPFGNEIDAASAKIDEVLADGSVEREFVFEGVPAAGFATVDVTVQPVDTADSIRMLQVDAVEASAFVWTVPWLWVIGVILLVTGVVLFVRWRRRRWRALKEELARATAGTGAADGSADKTEERVAEGAAV